MHPHPRYEILGTIAQGEFATVLHARDHELRREVAIKQIHQQYLAEPAKLERYWQEAHLLASIEHPYVLTIYDIVRDRGWLILELMQGSISQRLGGQPIDLDFLRVALICALHGLRVMADKGIVHGDVKPGNLLLDRDNRVKLGDFGIARRIQGDDGSLVKGATKYMAPEVVSDQFGPIGPHSDLYSLGFAAYELMCGEQFENLFPGLDMFGGNRQMAWIMWHAALDRRLPEINRVLAGVPQDLVAVIERLTEKDPARRYRTAEEAVADLRAKGNLPGAAQFEPEPVPDSGQRTRRLAAIAAIALSATLSLAMVFVPGSGPEPPPVVEAQPGAGIVHQIDLERGHFFLLAEGGTPFRVPIDPAVDRILLNGEPAGLEKLQPGDQINVHRNQREDGQLWKEVIASRSVTEDSGTIVQVDAANGAIVVAPAAGGESVRLQVPSTLQIVLNGSTKINNRPVRFADLERGDEAVLVQHAPSQGGRTVTALQVKRLIALAGTLVGVDRESGSVALRRGEAESGPVENYPAAEDIVVTLNGASQEESEGRPLTLADLRPGDRVTAKRDTHLLSIDAVRDFEASGTVKSLDPQRKKLSVVLAGQVEPIEFTLAPNCNVRIVGRAEPVTLASLRSGDTVKIKHDSHNLKQPQAFDLVAVAAPDKRTWAIVIGQQQYDDRRLPTLRHTRQDAQLMRDALLGDYRLAAEQLLFEIDTTSLRLKNLLSEFLAKVQPGSQLVVYFAGHAYLDEAGSPVLATKEFDAGRASATGLSLRWLIDELEACQAGEKILLLDTCRGEGGEGSTASGRQPSAHQVAAALKKGSAAVSRSVTLIAGCSDGQRSLIDGQQGLFAKHTAAAFAGEADLNDDQRVQATELFDFVQEKMAAFQGPGGRQQTPVVFRPDATPLRLTEQAQAEVRRLLGYGTSGQNIDPEVLRAEMRQAEAEAPGQPDFKLAIGLVFLRQSRTSFANQQFSQVLREHSDAALAHHGMAWLCFLDKDFTQGVNHLTRLLGALPEPPAGQEPGRYARHVYEWIGGLRGYLSKAVGETRQPPAAAIKELDAAVSAHGETARELYRQGYVEARTRFDRLQERLEAATSDTDRTRLQFEQRRLTYYSSFGFEAAENYLGLQLQK